MTDRVAQVLGSRSSRLPCIELVYGSDALGGAAAVQAGAEPHRTMRRAWRRLEAAPVELDGLSTIQDVGLPKLGLDGCSGLPAEPDVKAAVDRLASDLLGVAQEERPAFLAGRLAQAGDGHEATALVVAGRLWRVPEHAERLALAVQRFPSDPAIVLLAAMHDAREDRWDHAAARLAAVDAPSVTPAIREHLHHFRGLCAWHTGDYARAEAEWSSHEEGEHCPNLALADLAAHRLGHARARTVAGRLCGVVSQARARLAADEPRSAIALLDPAWVWACHERQSAALRAAAWLRIEVEPGSADALRRVIALTVFRDELSGFPWFASSDLPVADAWSAEQLEALDREVARALDEPEVYTGRVGHEESGAPLGYL